MRTLGIDLAAQPKETAACVIVWQDGQAIIASINTNVTDPQIIALHRTCDVTGIDAPFGWPMPFVEFVHAMNSRGAFELPDDLSDLYFRMTDLVVWRKHGKRPLVVAADKIAIPAMRCAGVLQQLDEFDRSGEGQVVEVYPAVALRAWGYSEQGLKHKIEGRAARSALLKEILATCHGLTVAGKHNDLCVESDHVFDAFVASLVARAAACHLTIDPEPHEKEHARIEGWIAVPKPGTLAPLLSGGYSSAALPI